jgi:hypothetical protein
MSMNRLRCRENLELAAVEVAYAYKLILPYSHTLILSYSHTLILSYSHTLIHSCTHALILSCTHTLILSCTHALIRSCTHALMHSCTHALTPYTHIGRGYIADCADNGLAVNWSSPELLLGPGAWCLLIACNCLLLACVTGAWCVVSINSL